MNLDGLGPENGSKGKTGRKGAPSGGKSDLLVGMYPAEMATSPVSKRNTRPRKTFVQLAENTLGRVLANMFPDFPGGW